MAHYYQKKWVFTWNADDDGQLVDCHKLQNLLNEISKQGVLQSERGKKNARIHYQGRFELKGSRTGKKQLLKMFRVLGCTKNLTFRPELSVDSTSYCVKDESRVGGPWYVGTPQYRRKNTPMRIKYRKWQEQFLNKLNSPLGETLRDCKVIWI